MHTFEYVIAETQQHHHYLTWALSIKEITKRKAQLEAWKSQTDLVYVYLNIFGFHFPLLIFVRCSFLLSTYGSKSQTKTNPSFQNKKKVTAKYFLSSFRFKEVRRRADRGFLEGLDVAQRCLIVSCTLIRRVIWIASSVVSWL